MGLAPPPHINNLGIKAVIPLQIRIKRQSDKIIRNKSNDLLFHHAYLLQSWKCGFNVSNSKAKLKQYDWNVPYPGLHLLK